MSKGRKHRGENKSDRKNVVLGAEQRRAMILDLLRDGPLTTAQICIILGWPNDTVWPYMATLYKRGKVRREARRVHQTREFVYSIRIDPEAYWSEKLTSDAYAY